MCDSRSASASSARPRWGRLYAILSLAAPALALVEPRVQASPIRIGLEAAVVAGVWGAVAAWLRANRVALDLEAWCDCGPRALTVRVITSRHARMPRPVDADAIDVCVEDGATLPM